MKILVFSLVLLQSCMLFAGEGNAEALYKLGISKLREAQSDHSALVPATKLLSQAALLYEMAGDEEKVTEVNSSLYWAKKKFTLADTEAVKSNGDITKRLEIATKEIPADQAKTLLTSADSYAKSHSDDPLLVAIRYFEVADRFKESEAGRTAMDLSLKAMQRIGEQIKREAYKAAPTDGKVFLKSEPVGAEILLVTKDGGKLETGKVTPALVQLPIGFQTVELNLKAHKPSLLTFEVDGKGIAKPDIVKLEALTAPVDVLYEEGWKVFVAGLPAKVVGTGGAETPCTIELPIGSHQITLAKDGFIDLIQRVEIKTFDVATTVEPKQKPSKGKSQILGSTPAIPTAASTTPSVSAPAVTTPKKFGPLTGDAMFVSLLGSYSTEGSALPFIALSVPDGSNTYSPEIRALMQDKLQKGEVKYVGFAKIYIPEDGIYLFNKKNMWFSIDGSQIDAEGKETFEMKLTRGIRKLSISSHNHGQSFIHSCAFGITNKANGTPVLPYNTYAEILQFMAKSVNKVVPKEITGWEPTEGRRIK